MEVECAGLQTQPWLCDTTLNPYFLYIGRQACYDKSFLLRMLVNDSSCSDLLFRLRPMLTDRI
jgi:hypothetical protein